MKRRRRTDAPRGAPTAQQAIPSKYPDVTPIIDHLNAALEAEERDRRLYIYRTPDADGGVLLASEQEAEELVHLRYVRPSPAS